MAWHRPSPYREGLLELKRMADASAQSIDPEERMELAIQATELVVLNNLDGTELTFGGAGDFHYIHKPDPQQSGRLQRLGHSPLAAHGAVVDRRVTR